MLLMRRFVGTSVAVACTIVCAFAQVDLKLVSVKPVGPDGTSAPVLGGASYGLRVKWTVPKTTKPYRVKFVVADRVGYASMNGAAGTFDQFLLFGMPLDGAIPYSATLDVDGVVSDPDRTNNVATGTFTPTPPAAAIQYFAAKTLAAKQDFSVVITKRGGLTSLATFFGAPSTGTSQSVLALAGPNNSAAVTTSPFSQPAYATILKPVPIGLAVWAQSESYKVTASSVMINAGKLTDTWAALGSLNSSISIYIAPEAWIPSTNASVVAYAKANLPANYQTSMLPIQAARALYQAVVRDLSYTLVWSGTALDALTTKKGNCGAFSSLYVACLRSIGIPSRPVCGYLVGTDQFHCWTEMYLPSAGWIPQDPTFANAICENGSFAYYFGVVPEMNLRASVSRAATNSASGYVINSILQQPCYFYTYSGVAPVISYTSHATLTVR